MRTTYHLAAAVAVVASCGLTACSGKSESAEPAVKPVVAPPPPVKVETAAVEIRKMPRYLTLTGSVIADRQSEVAANVSGRIQSAPIERGQQVRQGQVLAIVDSRSLGFTASAAAAQSRAAETQEKLAKADCDRADGLYEKGAVSKAEYERLKSACSSQAFTATAAQANADLAAKQLGDSTIRAPFDGVIGERYINTGEYVQPQTKVASVFRINPVRIQISVPETATPLVKQNATLAVQVAAWGDKEFPATVKYVAPALRPQTRDLLVEAVAPNTDGALRPGMFATVRLLVGEEDQPTVSAESVKTEGTAKRIFLARGGQAWEMVVRTAAVRDGRVAILEALAPGEKVIVRPPPGLHDGSAVQ